MKKLILVLLFLLTLTSCDNEPPKTLEVRVMNVNIRYGNTLVALLTDGTRNPWSTIICGEHPELWQGEHARVTLYDKGAQDCIKLKDTELLQ